MQLFTLKCPNCNGNLEIEDGIDTFYCKYCGYKIILDGQSEAAYVAKTRIKELEYIEKLQEKEHKQEQYRMYHQAQENMKERRATLLGKIGHHLAPLALIAIFMIAFYVVILVGAADQNKKTKALNDALEQTMSDIKKDIDNGDYDEAMIKAQTLVFDGVDKDYVHEWDEKRAVVIEQIKETKEAAFKSRALSAPISSSDIKGKPFEDVKKAFLDAGFANVKTVVSPNKPGFLEKAGGVISVSLAGDTKFKTGDLYEPDSTVTITHFAPKETEKSIP